MEKQRDNKDQPLVVTTLLCRFVLHWLIQIKLCCHEREVTCKKGKRRRKSQRETTSFKACTFTMFLTNTDFLWCHTLIFPFRGMLKHKGEISTDFPCVFLCINISTHKHRHTHTHKHTRPGLDVTHL